jgi:hypothetical protein
MLTQSPRRSSITTRVPFFNAPTIRPFGELRTLRLPDGSLTRHASARVFPTKGIDTTAVISTSKFFISPSSRRLTVSDPVGLTLSLAPGTWEVLGLDLNRSESTSRALGSKE